MSWRAARIVYGKELRDSLRDRRTIISMIVVPVIGIPLLMFGVGALTVKTMLSARAEVPRVMVVGFFWMRSIVLVTIERGSV